MTTRPQKPELLAPAGNMEKLEIAVHYGADAVYLAGKDYSLRNFSGNFTIDEMEQAIAFAHQNKVNVYVACNIFAKNNDIEHIEIFLHQIKDIGPDAVIISDPGILAMAFEIIPHIPIHLSTQANTTNYKSADFWKNLGVKRINSARELSLEDIRHIISFSEIEVEAFVHGAMCISYSGRCLLSSFMSQRDSNRGLCAHPCRWKYHVVEELRPGQYMPIAEDNRGSYIFNSRDLCMIEHMPEFIKTGITSLKIEGRMKSISYLASTVKIYREAIDAYFDNPNEYKTKKEWMEELAGLNNRGYCTGFYFNDPDQEKANVSKSISCTDKLFIGKGIEKIDDHKTIIEARNKMFKGDVVEIIGKKGPARCDKINDLLDNTGQSIPFAQPGSIVTAVFDMSCSKNDIIKKT
jgi:putative protease